MCVSVSVSVSVSVCVRACVCVCVRVCVKKTLLWDMFSVFLWNSRIGWCCMTLKIALWNVFRVFLWKSGGFEDSAVEHV